MARDPHTKATLARTRLIHQLRASDEPGAAAVAATLAACTNTAPCRSAACPVCGLAFQQAAVAVVQEFIREPARAIRNRVTALTVVPTSGCIPPDELTVEDFERVGAQITTALHKLRLPPTIIGLEASFNEDTTGRLDDHWCTHAHAQQIDWLSEAAKDALREEFPASRSVTRPVLAIPMDRDARGELYPFKPERFRRVTRLNSDHPTRPPFRETKGRPLRPAQAVRLALVEHQLGFGRRLLTHGLDERLVRERLRAAGWARDGP